MSGYKLKINDIKIPVLGISLHSTSRLRKKLLDISNTTKEQRYYEEDPRTDEFMEDFKNKITVLDSRFEYEANRRRWLCIKTEAWGMTLWKRKLTQAEIDASLAKYDQFYEVLNKTLCDMSKYSSKGIVYDFHSYNIRGRKGLPDINLGTQWCDRRRHGRTIKKFLQAMKGITVNGRELRVAENEIFKGGHMNHFISDKFPGYLVLSIEFSKFFMDEYKGTFHEEGFTELKREFGKRNEEFLSSMGY